MIDVAIKYLLVDLCIDVFFSNIFDGLELDVDNGIPKIGDVYSKISHKYADEIYFNCHVTDIEPIKNVPGEYIIYVRFTSMVGGDNSEYIDLDSDITEMVDSMSDSEVKEYVHAITNDVMDNMSREELEDIIYDEEIDMSDVDLVETSESNEVGLSTLFFTFYK